MTTEQLMDAIEVIDDSYIVKYTRGLPKKSQIHWGLISAAACFCLVISSVIFVLGSGLLPAIPDLDGPDIHDAWQYRYPHSGALSESRYYYLCNGDYLWYAELNGGGNGPLCSIPDCSHDSNCCHAYIKASDKGILYHSGYLYYYGEDDGTFHRRNADGTGDIRYDDPLCVVDTDDFAVAGQYLYYTGWAGGDTPDQTEYRLARMHLATGESEIFWRQAVPRDNAGRKVKLLAVQEAGALFLWSEGVGANEEVLAAPMHIAFWDGASGKSRELLQKTGDALQEVHLVTDGKLYFTGMGGGKQQDTKVFDLSTGRIKTAFKNTILHAVGGGYGVLYQNENAWSVIRLSTGKEVSCDILFARQHFLAIAPEGLVLYQNAYSGKTEEKIHYYLPCAAMADGIRQSDLVKLYASPVNSDDTYLETEERP